MTKQAYRNRKNLEELEIEYSRALETIARLESRISSLERENARLKQQVEMLRKDAAEFRKKYEKLKSIMARALDISAGSVRRLRYEDLVRILRDEFDDSKTIDRKDKNIV